MAVRLLLLTVSAVVIDRPSASESESVKECSIHMQQHTGICASTGTEQQSTESNHGVAQSTVDPDDSDSSVEESNESSSSSQSKQSDDDIFDNTPCDDAFPLPKSYVPENERYIPTPQQRLSRVEGYLKLENMEIPESVGDGYPHKMNAKTKERILEVKRRIRGRKMSSSDKKKFERFAAGRLWVCRRFALEPPEEESISVVSEPTPELKSILKPGSTFKPHGSKHDHSKKHQQKSSHDVGSREAKVHFKPETRILRYLSESSATQEYDLQLLPPESRFDRLKRQMLELIGYKKST
ncbi:hypothetical protein BDEG_28293 [Batrachochytrium dendrobatidis JEL423]|uniref:Uncharacterized protein n=1 Tax=Batrachochytrium dendrobatidis (strain JEL423) TaxID=403673 RepID=A0A177WZ39_BATDL|nr:hypothetical protein BDEG_28293 [Batrachochytrium dendrobatidis JEL423]